MARVLLVDDDPVARAVYGDVLEGGGHRVTPVGQAEEARTALGEATYDAVITDLLLPGSDGMELLRYIKERYASVEVIVITALDKVDPAVRAIKSGAAEYLVKPVAPEALLHAVSRALTTRSLLEENATLRRALQLAEAGQRMSSMIERNSLASAALTAFRQHCPSLGSLVFEWGRQGLKVLGRDGMDATAAEMLRPRIGAALVDPIPSWLHDDVSGWTLVVPAIDEGQLFGGAALVMAMRLDHTPPEASYLAQHLAIGLRNLGRVAQFEGLAFLDDLTHLYNARYLQMALPREVQNARSTRQPFSLLFLDLDRFKAVNDNHGHMVGSQVLVEIGHVLKGCVRDQDAVIRYGGDEYVVLLRQLDAAGAQKIAERIRAAIANRVFLAKDGIELRISASVGIASFPEHAVTEQELILLADQAMYEGKRGGRNRTQLAATIHAFKAER